MLTIQQVHKYLNNNPDLEILAVEQAAIGFVNSGVRVQYFDLGMLGKFHKDWRDSAVDAVMKSGLSIDDLYSKRDWIEDNSIRREELKKEGNSLHDRITEIHREIDGMGFFKKLLDKDKELKDRIRNELYPALDKVRAELRNLPLNWKCGIKMEADRLNFYLKYKEAYGAYPQRIEK